MLSLPDVHRAIEEVGALLSRRASSAPARGRWSRTRRCSAATSATQEPEAASRIRLLAPPLRRRGRRLPRAPAAAARDSSATSVDDDQHAARPRRRCRASTATSLTRPAFGERSSFSIFIASTTTTGWRASTSSPGATSTRTTRPGIGARTFCSPCAAPPAVGGAASGAAPLTATGDAPSAEVREQLAGRLARRELRSQPPRAPRRERAARRRTRRCAARRRARDAVNGDAEPAVGAGALDRHRAAAAVQFDLECHRGLAAAPLRLAASSPRRRRPGAARRQRAAARRRRRAARGTRRRAPRRSRCCCSSASVNALNDSPRRDASRRSR